MKKKLRRNKRDSSFLGVCSAFARFFDIDVLSIRVAWVVLFFFFGTGLLVYVVCAAVIPLEYEDRSIPKRYVKKKSHNQ